MKRSTNIKRLKQAATELNDRLGLSPPIQTDGIDRKYLIAKLREASPMIVPSDNLTEATEKVLESLSSQP